MPLGRPFANLVTSCPSCPSCPSWIRRSLTCSICPICALGWTKDLPCSVTPPRSEDPCTSPPSTARLSMSGTRPTPQINSISGTQISTFSRSPLSSRTQRNPHTPDLKTIKSTADLPSNANDLLHPQPLRRGEYLARPCVTDPRVPGPDQPSPSTHAPLDLLSVARARPSEWCRALRAPPGSFRHGPLDSDPRVRRIIRDYSRGLRASCWGRAATSVGHPFPGGWAAIVGDDMLCVKSRRLLGCGRRVGMVQRPRSAVVSDAKTTPRS